MTVSLRGVAEMRRRGVQSALHTRIEAKRIPRSSACRGMRAPPEGEERDMPSEPTAEEAREAAIDAEHERRVKDLLRGLYPLSDVERLDEADLYAWHDGYPEPMSREVQEDTERGELTPCR